MGRATSAPQQLLGRIAKEHPVGLGCACLLAVLAAVLELVPYVVVYRVVQDLIAGPTNHRFSNYLFWSMIALGAVLLRFVALGASNILSHAAAFDSLRKLRTQLLQHLSRLPRRFLDQQDAGALKKIVIDDVGALEGIIAHNLPDFVSGLLVPLLAAGALFFVNYKLALISLSLLPVSFIIQAATMRGMSERYQSWQDAAEEANSQVLEFIQNISLLKTYHRDAESLQQLRSSVYKIKDLATQMTVDTALGYVSFSTLLGSNLVVVLPSGLLLYQWGQIQLDQLVLFIVVGAGLTAPLLKLLFVFGNVQISIAGAERITSLQAESSLEEPQKSYGTILDASIELEHVWYSYPGKNAPALEDVSLKIVPGEVVGIVGASGAGKSTLGRLISRADDVSGGCIKVGGQDLRQLSSEVLRQKIAVVQQETFLLKGTVQENLQLAAPEAPFEALEEACIAANAHEFLEALPRGYQTELSEAANNLSGGQKQRLGLARTLLKNPEILILDEPTANIDPLSEAQTQKGLNSLLVGRTVLIIAHRLRTISSLERIVVLKQGRIIAEGSHQTLLDSCRHYLRMWNGQLDTVQGLHTNQGVK